MARDRPGPDPDRLIVAELTGAAQRHANWHELSEAETAAAAEELQEIAGNRGDLLVEAAGVLIGSMKANWRAEGESRPAEHRSWCR